MEARGVLHKVPAIDHNQREQHNQQQHPSGFGDSDSNGNRADGRLEPHGNQTSSSADEAPRQPSQQGYDANGNNNQQRTHGTGEGVRAGNVRQDSVKQSDVVHPPPTGRNTAGATDYDQQRMEVPPQGGGGSVGLRNFTTPTDAMQSQYEGDGQGVTNARGAAPNNNSTGARSFGGDAGIGSGEGPGHGHGHHAMGPPAAMVAADGGRDVGATSATKYDKRRVEGYQQGGVREREFNNSSDNMQSQPEGAGQGATNAGPNNASTGHLEHNQADGRNFGTNAGIGRDAGPAPGNANHAMGPVSAVGDAVGQGNVGARGASHYDTKRDGAGQGAINGGPNNVSRGQGQYDQDRGRANDHNLGADTGVGNGGNVENGHRDQVVGPAAAGGLAGVPGTAQGGHRGRHEPGLGPDQGTFDAETNLPVDGHATDVNQTTQGSAGPHNSGSVASGQGSAHVMLGTLQQAAGTLLNNNNMFAKGLERESQGIASRDPAQAQALQREAELARGQNNF